MARYMTLFRACGQLEELQQSLIDILRGLELDIIHRTTDYLVAKEHPGRFPLSRLVTVELVISPDRDRPNRSSYSVMMVAKNEELALHLNNHCQSLFNDLSGAIADAISEIESCSLA